MESEVTHKTKEQDILQGIKRTGKKARRLIAFFSMLLFTSILYAQEKWPVLTSTEITPPYSIYLSDYANSGVNKLAINVLLKDITAFNYSVKLRLIIEGEGITVTTSPSYMPQPIILDGGIPMRFDGSELAEYFDPNNLQFTGYSRQKFIQTGALPEGLYRIGFEVWDYYKNIAVSLPGLTFAWLVLNDPPIINIPEKNAKLIATEPQNIMFQWMPRHTGSPNAAFTTEYIFEIYEIWPDGRNPNEIVRTTQPLFEKTSYSTSYIYSNTSDPTLIPGKQYAYRVQAHDVQDRDLFRNNGWSEVQMFTYGDPCDVPTNIQAQSNTSAKVTLGWQPYTYNTEFYVQYRKGNQADAEWFPKTTYLSNLVIDGLEPNTLYEYQVKGVCGTINSDFSETLTFRTKEKRETDFSCGKLDSSAIITNTMPCTSLLPGDIISSGKFEVQVTSATKNGQGIWSGEGFARIPFMGVKLRVTFDLIKLNEKLQLMEGRIVSFYNENSDFVYNISNDGQGNEGGTMTPDTLSSAEDVNLIPGSSPDSIKLTDPISQIIKNDDGTTTVISATGDSIVVMSGTVVLGTDSLGREIVVESTGPEGENNTTGNNSDGTTADNSSTNNSNISFDVQQSVLKVGYKQKAPLFFNIAQNLNNLTNAGVEMVVDNPNNNLYYDFNTLEKKRYNLVNNEIVEVPTIGDKTYQLFWAPGFFNTETFPTPGKHNLTFNLKKDDKQLAQKVLQLEVLPKYNLTGLTATDALNTKRVAKTGETLYLVKKNISQGSRKVNYKVTNEKGDYAFWPNDIVWKTKFSDQSVTNYDLYKSAISIAHTDFPKLVQNTNTNITSVNAFNQELAINVQMLHQDKRIGKRTALADIYSAPAKILIIAKINEKLKSFLGDWINFNINLQKQVVTENDEDPNSPLYLNKKTESYIAEFEFNTSLSGNPKVFLIPSLSFDLAIAEIGCYIQPSFKGTIGVANEYSKNNFQADYAFIKDYFTAQLSARIEFGAKLSLDNAIDYVVCDIRAYGACEGGIKYNSSNKNFIILYINPLMAGVSGKISIPEVWDIVNFKYEFQVLDQKEWPIELVF